MMILRQTAYLASLLLLAVGHPAIAEECSSLSAEMYRIKHTLYEYALFAETAYGPTTTNTCVIEGTDRHIEMPSVETRPLLPIDIDDKWISIFREYWSIDQPPQPDNIGRYTGEYDVTYVTCGYDISAPQFALTWTEFRQTLGDDAPSRIDVHIEILPVFPNSMFDEVNQILDEEVGITRLSREPSSGNGSEELVAIQGTDFTRIPQIMSNIHHLLGGSCVYELAAIVVFHTGYSIAAGHVSVVGHSLGGGAVQYIVQDHAHQSRGRSPTLWSTDVTFSAYSFNSVGLRSSTVVDFDPSVLISYIVDREVVSWMGEHIGQTQVGTIIRYYPPSTWPDVGLLRFLDDVVHWENPEPVRRHRLPAIQQGLCACINGHGSIEQHYHPRRVAN